MSQAIRIDFGPRRLASPYGWLLLVAGSVAVAVALGAGHRIASATAVQLNILGSIEQQVPGAGRAPPTAAETRARDATLADMRRILEQLNLPWGGLFATLESLHGGDVALLSIAPDARNGNLRISGEARNLGAMLDYHRRLDESPGIRDVSLVSHEILEQVPERPVRFSLVATWTLE